MPEEENPFLVAPKQAKKEPEKIESFGTDEEVSFMVTAEEADHKKEKLFDDSQKPNWESSGTPIWDKKKVKDIHNADYEVVEHNES
jgi:hypothetical protein